jgi:hypothetical protein
MAEKFKKVACPTCGKEVEWRPESAFRPFCSQRCKLIDLGAWGNENYKVPHKEEPSDFESPD